MSLFLILWGKSSSLTHRDDIITAALAFFMDSHYQMECVACNSQQCLILNICFLIVCMCI